MQKDASDRNTIAVFKWKGRLPADEEIGADPATRFSEDYGEQWAYQACEPVAIAVLGSIRDLGHNADVDTPYFGEHAWHFNMELDDQCCSIMVQWIPGDDSVDSFAVEPSLRQGCIASMVRPQPPRLHTGPVRAALQRALEACPQIDNLKWVREI